MYDEPARPSPTPAPMAPPARAIPPPTNAPASVTASSDTAIGSFSSCRASWRTPGLCFCSVRDRSTRRNGRRLVVLRAAVVLHLLLVVVLVVVPGTGHREVEDGEQREDERLDHRDDAAEGLPQHIGGPHHIDRDQRD